MASSFQIGPSATCSDIYLFQGFQLLTGSEFNPFSFFDLNLLLPSDVSPIAGFLLHNSKARKSPYLDFFIIGKSILKGRKDSLYD